MFYVPQSFGNYLFLFQIDIRVAPGSHATEAARMSFFCILAILFFLVFIDLEWSRSKVQLILKIANEICAKGLDL